MPRYRVKRNPRRLENHSRLASHRGENPNSPNAHTEIPTRSPPRPASPISFHLPKLGADGPDQDISPVSSSRRRRYEMPFLFRATALGLCTASPSMVTTEWRRRACRAHVTRPADLLRIGECFGISNRSHSHASRIN
jgi:hypothetical protein